MSITRDILSFLLDDQILPLKYLILGQLHFEKIVEDLELDLDSKKYKTFPEVVEFIREQNLDEKLKYAASFNLLDLVKTMVSRGVAVGWLCSGAREAARKGHLEVLQYLDSQGLKQALTWMEMGALHGHLHIVQAMLVIKPIQEQQFKDLMKIAVEGGNLEIVEFLTTIGEMKSYNSILKQGAEHGHLHIIEFALVNGADNFKKAMSKAALGGHLHIVEMMLTKGVFEAKDYVDAVENAVYSLSEATCVFNVDSKDYQRDMAKIEEWIAIIKLLQNCKYST